MYLVGSTHSVAGSVFPSPNEEKEQTPAAELPQGLCGCVSVSATTLLDKCFHSSPESAGRSLNCLFPPPFVWMSKGVGLLALEAEVQMLGHRVSLLSLILFDCTGTARPLKSALLPWSG